MTIAETTTRPRATRIRSRLVAVALSLVAALVVWVIATLLGAELEVTSPLVGMLKIDALLVVVSVLPLALTAWGVLALLERYTARARQTWTIVASVVLVLSLPPLAFLDATLGTKVALAVMHLATGLVLILLLRRGARGTSPER